MTNKNITIQLGLENKKIENAVDYVISCYKKDRCQELYIERSKSRSNINFPSIQELIEIKDFEIESAFENLFNSISNTFLFSPIANYYRSKMHLFPEIEVIAFGEVDGAVDIWIVLSNDDFERRNEIAKINVEMMNIWSDFYFEFLTIPIPDNNRRREFLEEEQISEMFIGYRKTE